MMSDKKNVKTAETEKTKVSAVRSANKNEKEKGKDWHRAAALKAWETIRSRKQSKSVENKKEKKTKKEKKEVKEKQVKTEKIGKEDFLEIDEVNGSLDQLNRKDLDDLQKEQHKHQQRRTSIEKALSAGKTEQVRAVEVGKIIKNAKIERSSAGVKLVAVA